MMAPGKTPDTADDPAGSSSSMKATIPENVPQYFMKPSSSEYDEGDASRNKSSDAALYLSNVVLVPGRPNSSAE